MDLRILSDPRLWSGQHCRVTRRGPSGDPESGFIRAQGGQPVLQVVAGFVLYGYPSWEAVLEAGWRPE